MQKLFICLAILVIVMAVSAQQEVEIIVNPPTYLKFTNPPFVMNGVTFGPLREVAQALDVAIDISAFEPKGIIHLIDKVRGGTVTFVPLRALAEAFAMDIIVNKNYLRLGPAVWRVDGKLIVVDLDQQHVYAYNGLKQVYNCRTCTGRPGCTTPTGIFRVYKKIRGKYKVIGKPWDGVINLLHHKDADRLYPWTPIGTPIYIIP